MYTNVYYLTGRRTPMFAHSRAELLDLLRARLQQAELPADEARRCPAVAAVWGPVGELDDRALRRLQLAAEEGRGLGLLLRGASVRGRPSWADVRLLVRPLTRPSLCEIRTAVCEERPIA